MYERLSAELDFNIGIIRHDAVVLGYARGADRGGITTHILQACVTEPVKPLLDVVMVSSHMHVYISQSDRGEFVMGSEIEPCTTYRTLLRSWAGLCDLSPDYSPIVGKTLAELVHTGRTPELIAPFALERFYEDRLVSELAAAAVSH